MSAELPSYDGLMQPTRRHFLGTSALGLGALALRGIVGDAHAAPLPKGTHFPAKAKRVIYLFQAGGPSHFETLDPKPLLREKHTQPLPDSVRQGQRLTGMSGYQATLPLAGSFTDFKKYGQSGVEYSDLMSHTGGVADDLCVIRSMHTEAINHDPAITFFCSGNQVAGRPSMGAWASYGLLDALGKLNADQRAAELDPEVDARLAQAEMAYRMQTSVPEVADLSKESPATLAMYGDSVKTPGSFAANCLQARRLIEKGVRFVQLFHQGWDQHGGLPGGIKRQCKQTDQASAALIKDLKQRGLLEDTLVIWGGEFGRTAYSQGKITKDSYGRDHHPRCFSLWMAGGGVKGGHVHGQTDEFGYNIVKDPVHVHDLHATMQHLLGVDHERQTFKFQGRYYRLTDVAGHVVKAVIA